jgi:hypothetical protein
MRFKRALMFMQASDGTWSEVTASSAAAQGTRSPGCWLTWEGEPLASRSRQRALQAPASSAMGVGRAHSALLGFRLDNTCPRVLCQSSTIAVGVT